MKTFKKLIQFENEFDNWFAKNNILLIPAAAAILKLIIISMFPAVAGILERIENKNIPDYKINDVKIKIALNVVLNCNGYVNFGRSIATESAESNAPPCAPPVDDLTRFAYIKTTLEAILPALLDQLSKDKNTDKELANALRFSTVQKYIIYRISKKILDHDDKLTLDLSTAKGFFEFEKNVKAEIVERLSKTIEIARHAKKARPIMKDAAEDYYRQNISLDEKIGNIRYDGTQRNYYDIIQDKKAENPLSILLKRESQAEAQAIISKLSKEQIEQLIDNFDTKQRQKKGLLFDISSESEAQENQETINIFKYRRKTKPQAVIQLDLFQGGDE